MVSLQIRQSIRKCIQNPVKHMGQSIQEWTK